MRRSWKATEFYVAASLVLGLMALAGAGMVGYAYAADRLFAIVAAYMVSRTLWKKNRAVFHHGLTTSEFWFLPGYAVWGLFAIVGGHLPISTCFDRTGLLACLYILSRGFTKSIGMKTQTIRI